MNPGGYSQQIGRWTHPSRQLIKSSWMIVLKETLRTSRNFETGPLSSTKQHRQTYFIMGKSRQEVLLRLLNGRRNLVIKATHWAIRSPIVIGGLVPPLSPLGRNSSRPMTLVIPHQRGRTSNKLPKSLSSSISTPKNGLIMVVSVILIVNNVIS